MTQIRLANSRDAETLARLGAQTFTETFGHLYREQDLQAFLDESHSLAANEALLADDKQRTWVAETEDGKAVGFAVAGPCKLPVPDMPESAGELSRLYILKGYQSGGLGSRMLQKALDFLDENFDYIYLSVYHDNLGAQKLYARFGFEKIHKYFFMVGDHADPEWIMQLKR